MLKTYRTAIRKILKFSLVLLVVVKHTVRSGTFFRTIEIRIIAVQQDNKKQILHRMHRII